MNALSLLSQEDRELIDWYITTYGSYNGNEYLHYDTKENIEYILREWNAAKSCSLLGEIFKDRLIYSIPVDYATPVGDLASEIGDNSAVLDFTSDFYAWRRSLNFNVFDEEGSWWDLDLLVNYYGLAENRYEGATVKIKDPNRPGQFIVVQKGCKPVKMLGKLNSIFNFSDKFEAFRIAHSVILNKARVHGNLCLSIHPMDYLTMSDNACDWDSCMSWTNNGSYRQGTVEMMNSPYVIVAYLTASEPFRFYDKTWNNKKWRSLYIVDREIISSIKGYPYQIAEIDKIVIDKLAEMVSQVESNIVYDPVEKYDYNDLLKGDYYLNFRTGYMYNDFGTINHFRRLRQGLNHSIDITYSGSPECMWCGDLDPNIGEEGQVICSSCEDVLYCSCCGEAIPATSAQILRNGDVICPDCLAEYYELDIFDDYRSIDYLERIYVIPDQLKPYVENGTLHLERFRTDAPGINVYFNGYLPITDYDRIGKDHYYAANELEYTESKILNDDCHIKIFSKKTLFGSHHLGYVYHSELNDEVRRAYIRKMDYPDDYMEMDIYLNSTSYWDVHALLDASEQFGDKSSDLIF